MRYTGVVQKWTDMICWYEENRHFLCVGSKVQGNPPSENGTWYIGRHPCSARWYLKVVGIRGLDSSRLSGACKYFENFLNGIFIKFSITEF
jgi:hypothetical protein